MLEQPTTRRQFLGQTAAVTGSLVANAFARPQAVAAGTNRQMRGSAEHCIFLWLGGGVAHIDTWDPKRVSTDGRKVPGSAYPSIDTAISGVQVCEHLKRTAPLLDRCVPIRTVHHDVIDEHAAATYRMHVGRTTNGTVINPSLASIITHLKKPASDLVPAYVLMGNPSPARDPGFLGAENGYVYLSDAKSGPAGIVRPERVTEERHARRMKLLEQLYKPYKNSGFVDEQLVAYMKAAEKGFRLSGPEFLNVFDLNREPVDLRNRYVNEFGQRCLLARRLVERGSRFVEVSFNMNFVNGTGWDTHQGGQKGQYLLIQGLDQALSTLLTDLEEKRLLDKTLVVLATEFGRPADFDGGGGRGHQSECFSVVLAGGGIKTGQAVGVSDDLGQKILEQPVSVPDLFATIMATMGIDWKEQLYAGDRPVPSTDGGHPIENLFV